MNGDRVLLGVHRRRARVNPKAGAPPEVRGSRGGL